MPSPEKKWIIVGDQARTRLDRFVSAQFRGISRAYIQELILKGTVRVNGKASRKGDLIQEGDEVIVDSFTLPEERRIDPNPKIPLKIVWQSSQVVILDKPADLPTHPNDYSDVETLANAVLARFPNLVDVGDDSLRPGIVHRLDTDTSGLIMVARTPEAFRFLRTGFDERKIKKTYHALVLGKIETAGEVDFGLAHHSRNPRKMVAVKDSSVPHRSKVREAKTLYEPVEVFEEATLLAVRTLTGRMHQVRVHLSAIGHPLVGDRLYQTPKERQQDQFKLKRHFLHASKLRVLLPGEAEERTFESPLAPELAQLIETLRNLGKGTNL